MSTRVYGWDQNPEVDRFSYRCSNSSADSALLEGRAFEVIDGDGRRAIQLVEPDENSGYVADRILGFALSAANVLRFIKTSQQGDKLHYEIPMAGDRSLLNRHRRKFIRVSSRNLFSISAGSSSAIAARILGSRSFSKLSSSGIPAGAVSQSA